MLKTSNQLSQRSRQRLLWDGRWLLMAIIVAYFLTIALGSLAMPAYRVWRNVLGVPALTTPFRDLRVITAAWDCHRLGHDVLVDNPCLGGAPMNYPRLWLLPAVLGFNQSHTLVLGVLVALGFLGAVFAVVGRLTPWQAVIYGLVLCSPSVMLGVERGNSDLVVFVLLVGALVLLQRRLAALRYGAYGLIWVAATLKLFPIAALITALREHRSRCLQILGIGVGLFLIYGLLTWGDIQQINAITPRAMTLSYGSYVWLDRLLIPDRVLHGWRLQGLLSYEAVRTLLATMAVLCVMIPSGLWAFKPAASRSSPVSNRGEALQTNHTVDSLESQNQGLGLTLDSFRMGAAIYLATFVLVGNNWDYRLIFLILTMPQLWVWAATSHPLRAIARLTLAAIIFTSWWSRWSLWNLDELANWVLAGSFTYCLGTLSPTWLQQTLAQPLNSGLFSNRP